MTRFLFDLKQCSSCGETKPLDEFYTHPNAAKGRLHRCIPCHKEGMRINRLTNPEVQKRERLRAKQPERKRMSAQSAKRWREQYPQASRAQAAVNHAIRDGKLRRGPCVICGTVANVHGHHKNYNKPLDVTWLCAKCHHRLHIAFPELSGHGARS